MTYCFDYDGPAYIIMHADAKSECCMPAQAAAVAHWRVGHCPLQLLQLNRAIYSRKLNALKLHDT